MRGAAPGVIGKIIIKLTTHTEDSVDIACGLVEPFGKDEPGSSYTGIPSQDFKCVSLGWQPESAGHWRMIYMNCISCSWKTQEFLYREFEVIDRHTDFCEVLLIVPWLVLRFCVGVYNMRR